MARAALVLRLLGLILGLGCALACTPEGDAFGRGLLFSAMEQGINQSVRNEVNSNQTYSASCANCGQAFSWTGRVVQVRCPHCGAVNTISYGD